MNIWPLEGDHLRKESLKMGGALPPTERFLERIYVKQQKLMEFIVSTLVSPSLIAQMFSHFLLSTLVLKTSFPGHIHMQELSDNDTSVCTHSSSWACMSSKCWEPEVLGKGESAEGDLRASLCPRRMAQPIPPEKHSTSELSSLPRSQTPHRYCVIRTFVCNLGSNPKPFFSLSLY